MKTKDLIKQLQSLVDSWEVSGAVEVMGEHEISIDVFKRVKDEFENKSMYRMYMGVSNNLEITYSADGVYCILTAKETWE